MGRQRYAVYTTREVQVRCLAYLFLLLNDPTHPPRTSYPTLQIWEVDHELDFNVLRGGHTNAVVSL